VNVQEYIASGIVEKYVLGLADGSERAEFEQSCVQYPEIAAARREFEEKLEDFALKNAVTPPPVVRKKVLEAIQAKKIITMENVGNSSGAPAGVLRFVAAASLILLVVFAWLYIMTRSRNIELAKQKADVDSQLVVKTQVLDKIQQELTDVVKNPHVTMVNMVGTRIAPRSSANVYWDSASTNVYLVVKNMPKLPSNEQYQLWALIDKEKKDLGVFDGTEANVILKMKNTQKAQAFAITIEQTGGAKTPNLDSLQSVGKMTVTQ
jgi:anti-sigma-K factor RskA